MKVTGRDIMPPSWPASADGYRIGLLTDLHCDRARAVRRAAEAAMLLAAQTPDVILLGGDYISHGPRRWARPAAEALRPLAESGVPTFAVLGNHDWGIDQIGYWNETGADLVAQELGLVGIRVLRNQSVPLPGIDGVWVVGLDDCCARRQDIAQALSGVPAEACRLLLVHEPDYADEAPPGFVLQLSGHSHAGQIRLPGLPPPVLPRYGRRYPEGLKSARHHPVYTSRGIGTTEVPIRLFCPPEISVLRLRSPEATETKEP